MTKSEEWEQFSAYRPMIEDAIKRGREQREAEIIALLETTTNWDGKGGYFTGAQLFSLAALIKRENNE